MVGWILTDVMTKTDLSQGKSGLTQGNVKLDVKSLVLVIS